MVYSFCVHRFGKCSIIRWQGPTHMQYSNLESCVSEIFKPCLLINTDVNAVGISRSLLVLVMVVQKLLC